MERKIETDPPSARVVEEGPVKGAKEVSRGRVARPPVNVEARHAEATEDRNSVIGRGVLPGVAAGVVGLACCVGPAVAALLGIMSATVAVDVANNLYGNWGWAFKLTGAGVGLGAFFLARRRLRSCGVERPRLGRFAATLIAVGLTTYGALYALTTWAERFA